MFIVKMLGNGSCFWIGGKRSKSEGGDLFENYRIVGSLRRGLSPTKWSMARNQHRREAQRIEFRESVDDGVSSVGFVV